MLRICFLFILSFFPVSSLAAPICAKVFSIKTMAPVTELATGGLLEVAQRAQLKFLLLDYFAEIPLQEQNENQMARRYSTHLDVLGLEMDLIFDVLFRNQEVEKQVAPIWVHTGEAKLSTLNYRSGASQEIRLSFIGAEYLEGSQNRHVVYAGFGKQNLSKAEQSQIQVIRFNLRIEQFNASKDPGVKVWKNSGRVYLEII